MKSLKLYTYPNKFLEVFLKDIDDMFPKLIEFIKNKNIKDAEGNVIDEEFIKKVLSQQCYSIVVGIYSYISSLSVNSKTILSFENSEFLDISNSIEHKLQNLTMLSKANKFDKFCDRSQEIYKNETNPIIKGLVSMIVLEYFYEHEVPLMGKAQTITNLLFDTPTKRKIQINRAKKKGKFA